MIWATVAANETRVALEEERIGAGQEFALTADQMRAVEEISGGLASGRTEFLLKAPTGSGKTEVMFRVALNEVLRTKGYVTVLAPTRDLIRQDARYFRERLAGTGLEVVEYHGGIAPRDRRSAAAGLEQRRIHFLIGSAMMLTSEEPWDLIDRGTLTVIDDVNAFDEEEHLRYLENLNTPLLFASATPNDLRTFLTRIGAYQRMVTMEAMPFASIPTKIHHVEGIWGEPAAEQLTRAEPFIREHIERRSRIFVIGRRRGDVPALANRLEATYALPVQQLHGEMMDSAEHHKRGNRSRERKKPTQNPEGRTRIEMMRAFLEQTPSILAATNLVGSGLDISAADLIVVTDADTFGAGEIEQLIGRVGRRERPSDAVLIVKTSLTGGTHGKAPRCRTFAPPGRRGRSLKFRR